MILTIRHLEILQVRINDPFIYTPCNWLTFATAAAGGNGGHGVEGMTAGQHPGAGNGGDGGVGGSVYINV